MVENAEVFENVELFENVEMLENVEMMELGEINVPFNGAVARRGNLSPLLSVGKLENRNRNIALENKRKPLERGKNVTRMVKGLNFIVSL